MTFFLGGNDGEVCGSSRVVHPGPTDELPIPTSGACVRTTHLCNFRHGAMVMMELHF